MAIYSMNNNRFAGPKSDTPWKPSPAMKMRQAAAADRVQTSAKQDALDFKSDAANAGLRQQVEAATLRQQLFGLNQMKQQQRTLGRNLPLSSGPTTNTAPRPTTLGLSQGASERSQPVNPGWGARNVLTPQAAQTAPGDGPTSQRLAQGRPGSPTISGGAAPPRKSSSAPMGEKYGRRTGAGPPPGLAAVGGGAKPSLGAAARRPRPGAAAPTWTPKPSTPGQATRGASSLPLSRQLGGGNVQSQPWAGDVYDRNRRGSEGPMTSGGITPDITPTGPVTRGSSPRIQVSNPGAAANPGRYGGFAGGFPKKPASVVQGRSSSSSRSRGGSRGGK